MTRSQGARDGNAVLFWPFPTFPHIGPTLGLAQELTRRGYRVSYAAPEAFRSVIASAGATLLPYEPPFEPLVAGSEDPIDFAFGYYLGVLSTASLLERELLPDPPAALVYDTHLWGTAAGLARKLGASGIQSFPTFASNEHFSLRRAEADAAGSGGHPSVEVFHREVAAFARARGFGEYTREEFLVGYEDHNVVFMPREFQLAADTFDDRFAFVGPCVGTGELAGRWTPPAPPGPGATRPRIVLASLGTSPFGHDAEFYRSCVTAFADSGCHLVLTLGDGVDVESLGPLPPSAEAHSWLRHPAVLRHADLMISQAGIGSMMEALSFGVPLVLSPRNAEQAVNAGRAEALGVARPMPDGVDPDALLESVLAVASDPGVVERAGWMRAAIERAGGPVRAADFVTAALDGRDRRMRSAS